MARRTKTLETWCQDNNRLDILEEWDKEKNKSLRFPKHTCDVNYNTPSNVHWKCHKNHEWEASVVSRTIFNLKCPMCHPETIVLPVGTNYGCLTIIGGFEEYKKDVADSKIEQLKRDKADFLKGIRKQNSNISSVDFYEHQIESFENRELYKCQCKCGQVQYLSEFQFLEKKTSFFVLVLKMNVD